MFSNIGDKIKLLAAIICWVGILASFVGGMSMMSTEVGLGFIIMIAGSLISWVSSFFMFGFGELIACAAEMAENTRPKGKRKPKKDEAEFTEPENGKTFLDKAPLDDLLAGGYITEEEYREFINTKT